jgi:hypothetical protein
VPLAAHTPQPPRASPRPLATGDARQGPQPGRGVLSNRAAPDPAAREAREGRESPKSVRGRRRSRENLDADAKQAGVLETAPQTAVDTASAERALRRESSGVTAVGRPVDSSAPTARSKRRLEPDPTVVTHREDLVAAARFELAGGDLDPTLETGDRATAFAIPTAAPAPSVAPPPVLRAPATSIHDPGIQTSQAVRVVVWRDANGVHLAPSGTVVSAITIDAVLVALEPSADLTAWLSKRER